MNTRTFEREGHVWSLEIQPVKGHTPFSHMATLRRDTDLWATVKRKHNGALNKIMSLPTRQVPASVWAEVKRDFNNVGDKAVASG